MSKKPIDNVVDKPGYFFKMKNYARFAEMNMIPITIPKVQLLSFVTLIH